MTVCPRVAQACLNSRSGMDIGMDMAQIDGNLSLGTTSLFVPDTFKFKNFET